MRWVFFFSFVLFGRVFFIECTADDDVLYSQDVRAELEIREKERALLDKPDIRVEEDAVEDTSRGTPTLDDDEEA